MRWKRSKRQKRLIILGAIISTLGGCQASVPETADVSLINNNYTQIHMIASAHEFASEAGRKMLRDGGSAIDAAISAQMVLNLVEPQSSGIGGGGFLLHFNAKTGTIESYDGRETAPQSAHTNMFLRKDGTPKSFLEAAVGGAAVGVPGLIRMLEMAHREHGKLPWEDLFLPAIQLAEDGFPLSSRLAKQLTREQHLRETPAALGYFYDLGGGDKTEGTILKNPYFAETMRRIAKGGADAFYQGPIAESIVFATRNAKKNPGNMALSDLADYRAIKRKPVCKKYRTKLVCGMGPPSSGGLTTLQILGLLSRFNLQAMAPASIEAVHLISEAGALAFADRNTYIGDSDYISVPGNDLISSEYLKRRATLINPRQARKRRKAGVPIKTQDNFLAPGDSTEGTSTTHISVVDGRGNAVSMTSSVENTFGSRQMASGFLLNNQLTDFSFRPQKNGQLVANRVAAGKRPRSSMSPTIVLNQNGSLMMVIGSPGGPRIIGYVAKVLVGVIDWNLPLQDSIDLPNFLNRNTGTELEKGSSVEALGQKLEAQGHSVTTSALLSGLQGIKVTPEGLEGGTDKRRGGVFLGD